MLNFNKSIAAVLSCIFCSACFIVSDVYAGGLTPSRDTPVNSRGWQEFWERERDTKVPRHDKIYVEGKKIYKGKGGHEKISYCVPDFTTLDDRLIDIAAEQNVEVDAAVFKPREKIKLSRKTLAPYKELKVTDFIRALYDCDQPDTLVLNKLDKESAGLVVYYLNARYKLKLKQQEGAGKLAKIRHRY